MLILVGEIRRLIIIFDVDNDGDDNDDDDNLQSANMPRLQDHTHSAFRIFRASRSYKDHPRSVVRFILWGKIEIRQGRHFPKSSH